MSITLLSSSVDQRYLHNIQDSLSNISKANTLAKKIIKVAGLIILFPLLVIKDSAHHVKRCFVKKNSKLCILEVLEKSQNYVSKHKFAILKVALISSAYLGLIHPRFREWAGWNVSDQSWLDDFVETATKLSGPKKIAGGRIACGLGLGLFFVLYRSKKLGESDQRLYKIKMEFKDLTDKDLSKSYDIHCKNLLEKIEITRMELDASGWLRRPFIRLDIDILKVELDNLQNVYRPNLVKKS